MNLWYTIAVDGIRDLLTGICLVSAAALTSLPSSARSWLWRPGWDMARVTRRGVGVPAEWFSCDSSGRVFTIGLR